jgi:hypothetical protein
MEGAGRHSGDHGPMLSPPFCTRSMARKGGDQHPVIVDAARAALEPAVEIGFLDAVERAVDGGEPGVRPSHELRVLPGAGEAALRAGAVAQRIGRLAAHSDAAGGKGDDAELRQRQDEAALTLGRPSVMAVAGERDGLEGEGVSG